MALPLTKAMSTSITEMIRMDHDAVLTQFHKIRPDTGDSVRDGVVKAICALLEIHAQLEEEIFYSALRENGVQSVTLEKSQPEHEEMRRLIARVRELEGQRLAQDDALNELINKVMHHVADEETQLLPAAERFLGPQRLHEMGAKMTARRMELMKPRAAELAGALAKASPAKTALLAMGAVGAVAAAGMLVNAVRRDRHVDGPAWRHARSGARY
jgi:hemerythrin-like domain-containing protein